MRRVADQPQEVAVGDGVDEPSLGDVTVCEAGEGRRQRVVHDHIIDETELSQGDAHVAQLWAAPDQTGALGSDEADAYLDVVAVVFVFEGQPSDFTVRNTQGETLAGRLGAEPPAGWYVR